MVTVLKTRNGHRLAPYASDLAAHTALKRRTARWLVKPMAHEGERIAKFQVVETKGTVTTTDDYLATETAPGVWSVTKVLPPDHWDYEVAYTVTLAAERATCTCAGATYRRFSECRHVGALTALLGRLAAV